MDKKQRQKVLKLSKADVDAIRRILMDQWNPIGFAVPDDEYDSYIPGIYRLIQDGADAYKLAQRLLQLEMVSIGVQGNAERAERVANSLLALRTSAF
jgi:hypothetical protein